MNSVHFITHCSKACVANIPEANRSKLMEAAKLDAEDHQATDWSLTGMDLERFESGEFMRQFMIVDEC